MVCTGILQFSQRTVAVGHTACSAACRLTHQYIYIGIADNECSLACPAGLLEYRQHRVGIGLAQLYIIAAYDGREVLR